MTSIYESRDETRAAARARWQRSMAGNPIFSSLLGRPSRRQSIHNAGTFANARPPATTTAPILSWGAFPFVLIDGAGTICGDELTFAEAERLLAGRYGLCLVVVKSQSDLPDEPDDEPVALDDPF